MTVDKQLLDLTSTVSGMDAKLDTLLTHLPGVIKDHEDRIKSMERKWNIATGVGITFSTVSAIIGTVLTFVYDIFHIFPSKG